MSVSDDDAVLLARIADQDKSALRLLFQRYQVRLFRFIYRTVRNEAVAEELTNEVFLEVWRFAGRYEGRSAPSTWIFTIGRNKAISHLRKRREEGADDDVVEAMEDSADNPEIQSAKRSKADIMRACLEKLSNDHREVVDLVYYQDMSIAAAAAVLEIPENTVKTRMFHARKNLSEHFRRAGIDRGWP